MEHELNYLCGLIERQHGVIESLARFSTHDDSGSQSLSATLHPDRLALPLERARPRTKTASAGYAEPAHALVAPAGMSCFSLRHRDVRVCAVPAFGLDRAELEALVGAVSRLQIERKDFKPVFITDSPDLDPFVKRAYAVEYIPFSRFSAGRDGLLRKLRAIREKWNIGSLWDFGRDTDFFCPVCSSREFRVVAPRSSACLDCGSFEWHRELARWCLDQTSPGTRVICPTGDPVTEAICRHLELDIVSVPTARFLSPRRRDRFGADLIMLCASRDEDQLREENVLAAAWHYLDRGGRLIAAYYDRTGDSAAASPGPESISRELFTRWDISVHPAQSGLSQLDSVPELRLLSSGGGHQVELVTATRKFARA